MLTIDVVNTRKGTNENAQYRYRVHVNGEEIQRGEVDGHNRGHGWAVLLSSIADKHLTNEDYFCKLNNIKTLIKVDELRKRLYSDLYG